MNRLTIFDDDNIKIASITIIDNKIYILARSVRYWQDVSRWINQGFYRLDKKKNEYVKIEPKEESFLILKYQLRSLKMPWLWSNCVQNAGGDPLC